MNKKASHVDWAISMGIFLVYLVGLFILLRPGITPIHKPESLFKILEDNFNEDVVWEVKEIPLFVELCFGDSTNNPTYIQVEDEKNNFKFSRVICEKIGGGNCLKPWDEEQSGGNNFRIDCRGIDGEKPNLGNVKFTLTYHIKPLIDKDSIPDLTSKENLCNTNDIRDCEAYLGASTSKEGINDEWLITLKNKDYDNTLRGEDGWRFPEDKDFAIYEIYSEQDPIFINGVEEIPQGINIFTKEIKTNILSPKGDLTPITISLKIW